MNKETYSREDLKIWINDNLWTKTRTQLNSAYLSTSSKFYNANICYFDSIIERTKYLPNDVKIGERIYHILNDLYSASICPICNRKGTNFISIHKGYSSYCSYDCSNKSKEKVKPNLLGIHLYNVMRIAKEGRVKFYALKTREEYKEWIVDNVCNNRGFIEGQRLNKTKKLYKNNKFIFDIIESMTRNICKDNLLLSCRCILDDIYNIPKCEVCGKNSELSYNNKFRKRCNNCRGYRTEEEIDKNRKTRKSNLKVIRKNKNFQSSNLSKQELIDFIQTTKDKNGKYSNMKTNLISKWYLERVEIFNQIIEETNWLPNDAKMVERLYCLDNNLISRPKCKCCNINEIVYSGHTKYEQYCSYSCGTIMNNNSKHKRRKYYNKPTILYYIKIEKEGFDIVYKIGITKNSVYKRFKDDINKNNVKITTLKETLFETGEPAYKEEQRILRKYYEFKYWGDNILICGGNSELFTKDILDLDKE